MRCESDILVNYFYFFRDTVDTDFILTGCNACPDTAHMGSEILESEEICLMHWSARSPDLNHIIHVCDTLRKKNCSKNSLSQNHLKPENSIAEVARLTAIATHKLSDFQY